MLRSGVNRRRETTIKRLKEILGPVNGVNECLQEPTGQTDVSTPTDNRVFVMPPVTTEALARSGNSSSPSVLESGPAQQSSALEQTGNAGQASIPGARETPAQLETPRRAGLRQRDCSNENDVPNASPAPALATTSAIGESINGTPLSNNSDPLRQPAVRIAGDFMTALAGAVKEVQLDLDAEVGTVLVTVQTMSSEIHSLGDRFVNLRRDVDRITQEKRRPALEAAALENIKRAFEASQKRTMELVMGLAAACNESSRLVGSQIAAVSSLERRIIQLLEEV